ncbi:MAG: hypothetical protein ACI4EF_11865, partial [Coprococcus sp.]
MKKNFKGRYIVVLIIFFIIFIKIFKGKNIGSILAMSFWNIDLRNVNKLFMTVIMMILPQL